MLGALREYIPTIIRFWWLLVPGVAAEAYDVVTASRGERFKVPRRRVFILFLAAFIVAQFLAYQDMRKQREEVQLEGIRPSEIYVPLNREMKRHTRYSQKLWMEPGMRKAA